MPVYDVTLNGYQSDTDETDHLVKWVMAPKRDVLDKFLHGVEFIQSISEMGKHADAYTPDHGVDVILGEEGEVLYSRDGKQTLSIWGHEVSGVGSQRRGWRAVQHVHRHQR